MADLSKSNNIPMLIDVIPTGYISLSLAFDYSDNDYDYKIDLKVGNKYDLIYVENRELKRNVGVLRDVTKIYTYDDECIGNCGCGDCSGGCKVTSTSCGSCGACNSGGLDGSTAEYLLTFDCSSDFSCNKVRVKTSQLRSVTEFIPYADESTEMTDAKSTGGTTTGKIIKVEVTGGEVDPDKNKGTGGEIGGGDIDDPGGTTEGGATTGTNPNGNTITIVEGKVYGGKISSGTLISGDIVPGSYTLISGTTNADTGKIENAHYTADFTNIVVINSTVTGGRTDSTSGGRVIDTTMKDPIIFDGTITDPNNRTTNGTTIGNITYAGISTGTVTGGIAYGIIDGRPAILEGNITTIGAITSGGITTGGTIIGGSMTYDGVTIGATIAGGKTTGGIAYGGKTTGGTVSFDTSKITGRLNETINPTTINNSKNSNRRVLDGLIVSNDYVRGVRSNIADNDAHITPAVPAIYTTKKSAIAPHWEKGEEEYFTSKKDIDRLFNN